MADGVRFSDKSPISTSNVKDTMIVPCTQDSVDKKIKIAQLQQRPIFTCSTSAATGAKSATSCDNFAAISWQDSDSLAYFVGRECVVIMQNAQTSTDTVTLSLAGSTAYNMTVNGSLLGEGAWKAGTVLHVELLPSGSTYVWNVINSFVLSSDSTANTITTPVGVFMNASAVNGALADYIKGVVQSGTVTTGSTYAEITLYFTTARSKKPFVKIMTENANTNAIFNSWQKDSSGNYTGIQYIIRNASGGTVVNTSITYQMMILDY